MIKNLLKIDLKSLVFSMVNKSNKKMSPIKSYGFLLLLVAYIMVISGIYANNMLDSFIALNIPNLFLLVLFLLLCVVTLFFTIMKSSSSLFISKDYEFLVSLPISIRKIIASKILFIYISNILITSMFVIPAFVVFIARANPSFSTIIYVLLVFPFISLIPIVISSIIGVIITYIASFFANPKLAISVIGLLALLGIMILPYTLFQSVTFNLQTITDVENMISMIYPPVQLAYRGVTGNILMLLIFIILSVLAFVVFVFIVEKYYVSIRTKLTDGRKKSNKKVNVEIKNTIYKTLLIKEWKKILSIPVFTINVLLSPVLAIGASVLLIIYKDSDIVSIFISMGPLLPVAIAYFSTISPTSTCSLSLEGESFSQIKTLPIPAKTFLLSIVYASIIVTALPPVILGIVAAVILDVALPVKIFILIFPACMSILSSILGLLLNVRFVNLHYQNPTAIIKQSAPVMINVFGSIIINMTLGFLFIFVPELLSNYIYIYGGLVIIMVTSIIIMYNYIVKNANKILLNIN